MTTPTQLVLFSRGPDGVFALWRRSIVLQVRRGALTLATLESAASVLRGATVSGRPLGALLVVEAGAPLPGGDVREVQRVLLRDLGAHEHVRVAPVILGDDVTAALQRSAGRLVAVGNPRVQRFETIPSAAGWLASELTGLGAPLSSTELVLAVEQLRAMS